MVKIISATPKVRHYTQQASVLEELPVGTAVDILKVPGINSLKILTLNVSVFSRKIKLFQSYIYPAITADLT